MPSAPEVVMTPAPKRLGKPCATIAGRMIEPIATTVAGDEPEIAANNAQAITPARPRPPYQCPTMRGRERDHPPRDAAVGQEVAGQDEERDRHDLEVLDAGEQLQRHRLDRHVGHREQIGQHGEAERDRDRHAGQHQHDQQAEDDGRGHRAAPRRRTAVHRARCLRRGSRRGAAAHRSSRTSRRPAGTGSTSGRTRPAPPRTRSSAALRDRRRPDRWRRAP